MLFETPFRDISAHIYNHLGGDYYEGKIGAIMEQWNLYQYDREARVFTRVSDGPRPPRRRFRRINMGADSSGRKFVFGNVTISVNVDN